MKTRTAMMSLAVVVLVSGGFVVSSAFTSATLTRDANIDVVSDGTGLIELSPGAASAVYTDSDGALAIDFAEGAATGVNGNAEFTLGSSSNLTGASSTSDVESHDYAFTVTLNDEINGTTDDLQLSYTSADADGNGDANVEFTVYPMGGSALTTASEESSGTITDPTKGTTYYVVLTVDTGAGDAGTTLGSSDDLSGTLTIQTA